MKLIDLIEMRPREESIQRASEAITSYLARVEAARVTPDQGIAHLIENEPTEGALLGIWVWIVAILLENDDTVDWKALLARASRN